MFEVRQKVVFSRGPMEFVGEVIESSEKSVKVSGVEVGCHQPTRTTVTSDLLSHFRVIDEAEFAERTLNEPAYADTMSKERFMALADEIVLHQQTVAKGEETDQTMGRIREIEVLMTAAPWVMDPDQGCVAKSAAATAFRVIDATPPANFPAEVIMLDKELAKREPAKAFYLRVVRDNGVDTVPLDNAVTPLHARRIAQALGYSPVHWMDVKDCVLIRF